MCIIWSLYVEDYFMDSEAREVEILTLSFLR